MSLLAALGLTLSLASPATAGVCTNDAGSGDIAEGETCKPDDNNDTILISVTGY